MSGVTRSASTTPPASAGGVVPSRTEKRKKRYSLLTRRDKITLWVMAGIPTFLVVFFILLPTVTSVLLSFTSWNGVGGIDKIKFIGLKNYADLFTIYKPFWPAVSHNLIWLGFFLFVATPLGMLLAVLLDKNIRGTRVYQSALYMPVVLSLAIVGFIWQLIYAPEQGLLNQILRIGGVARQGVGDAVQIPGLAVHERTKRSLVAAADLPHQFDIFSHLERPSRHRRHRAT